MLPSKDIGSIGPPGLRIWLKKLVIGVEMGAAVGYCKLGDYCEIVPELASPVRESGANDFRVAIECDSEFGERQNA